MDPFLEPTPVIDCGHPTVRAFALEHAGNESDPAKAAARLFLAVRDVVTYDPFTPFYEPGHYLASRTLETRRCYCVIKAVALAAVARAAGIPARLGFADMRNHGAPADMKEVMGTDVFAWHGFAELFVNGAWRKATPAFHADLCRRHDIEPLVFDGASDAVFPARDLSGRPYVEYLAYHGSFADLPLERIMAGWRRVYGDFRVDAWIAAFEPGGSAPFP